MTVQNVCENGVNTVVGKILNTFLNFTQSQLFFIERYQRLIERVWLNQFDFVVLCCKKAR